MGWYNPIDIPESTTIKAGDYSFKLDHIEEKQFTNCDGIKATLLVDVGGRDVTVYDNLFPDNPKAMWKVKGLMESLGLDYHNPGPLEDLIGRLGRAKFVMKKREDGREFLEVGRYIEAPTLSAGSKPPPPAVEDEDPFK